MTYFAFFMPSYNILSWLICWVFVIVGCCLYCFVTFTKPRQCSFYSTIHSYMPYMLFHVSYRRLISLTKIFKPFSFCFVFLLSLWLIICKDLRPNWKININQALFYFYFFGTKNFFQNFVIKWRVCQNPWPISFLQNYPIKLW